mmetsp:Transcript_36425/g.48058  ORF Transcript_36425/g.48058 Transcript_36425/m.48058 type:complete len:97 (-) Transcript_36425:154-444(-)
MAACNIPYYHRRSYCPGLDNQEVFMDEKSSRKLLEIYVSNALEKSPLYQRDFLVKIICTDGAKEHPNATVETKVGRPQELIVTIITEMESAFKVIC